MADSYAMVQTRPDDAELVGDVYFASYTPWTSYRLSTAIEIASISEDEVCYRRLKYRLWGSFYKLEPEYTSEIYDIPRAHLISQISRGYSAVRIKNQKCIFTSDLTRYVLGSLVTGTNKTHALEVKVETMWNSDEYLAAYYFCSGTEMSGLSEVIRLPGISDVTMDLNTARQQRDIITCLNCLRKLRR